MKNGRFGAAVLAGLGFVGLMTAISSASSTGPQCSKICSRADGKIHWVGLGGGVAGIVDARVAGLVEGYAGTVKLDLKDIQKDEKSILPLPAPAAAARPMAPAGQAVAANLSAAAAQKLAPNKS